MKCKNMASYRFTWPGRNESVICEEHVGKLLSIAQAMGIPLQVIPLDMDDTHPDCEQEVKE